MLDRMYNEKMDKIMDNKMAQNKDNTQTLEMELTSNDYIDLSCKVRSGNHVDKNDAVNVYFRVSFDGKKVREIIDVDMKVRFQSTLRNSFDTQMDLQSFARQYATMDKPYNIHFDNLSKKVVTPEQRKNNIIRGLKETGMTIEEIENAMKK